MESREKTKEQLQEDLGKTREELDIQKWGNEKTLVGIKVLVKEIKEAKAKNEAMLASIGYGLAMVDTEGKITYINNSFEVMLGWKMREVIGKSLAETITREDKNGTEVLFKERILSQVLSGKNFVADSTNPFYFIRKDKSKFPVSIVVAPVVLSGKIIGAIETFRDISESKKAEEYQVRLATLVEATSDYASVADLNGNLTYLNEAGLEMIGLDKNTDITRLKIADVHPAWSKKIILEEGLPYAEQHGSWTGETALLHRDGHEIPVSQVIVIHKGKDGKIDLTATLMRDITERKKAENTLRENEERYRALINVVPLCIKWFDSAGNLVSVNQHGKEEHFLVGKSEEELKNWKYMECIEEKYRDLVKERMQEALLGKASEFDMEHVPGTATGHWCHSYLVPAAGDNGKVKYVLFISRDFTSEKIAEEEKNKNIDMLEKFRDLTSSRELRMIELKKKIEELTGKKDSTE